MIVGKELFGAHTVAAPIGAIHRDRHTGQFRDHMAIGLGVTFKTACLSLGPGSASSLPVYVYIGLNLFWINLRRLYPHPRPRLA
jgi:hypothetical protein